MLNNIVAKRQERHMTRVELAQALGATTVSVWRWETGKQTPQLETMQRLAKALHTSIQELFPELPALIQAHQTEEPVPVTT